MEGRSAKAYTSQSLAASLAIYTVEVDDHLAPNIAEGTAQYIIELLAPIELSQLHEIFAGMK
jgi:hypothetical protein